MPLTPGTRLGRFEIASLLGQGGMGEVYRARDPRLARDVAIKVLAPSLHADPTAVRRFESEARAVSALQHPGIVAIFDFGTEHGQPYLVTELLEGSTLRHRLAGGPLPVREVLDIAIQIAQGLGAAHQAGVVHRDIKPENLFLTRAGARILDFGIARLRSEQAAAATADETVAATKAGTIIGTAGYMAPEQIRGMDVDARADIFALGCVIHEMLAGSKTFDRATPMDAIAASLNEPAPDLPPSVPAPLGRIVERCLQKDREDRFQSARDLAFALAALRNDSGATATRSMPTGASWRRPAPVWSIAAALVATGVAVWAWTSRPAATPSVALDAQLVVPMSARPIAPAIAPDGSWIAYVSVADAEPRLLVQFLNGAAPLEITKGLGIPVANRSIIGGIDIKPDGSAIGLVGPPRATGLWATPGAFFIPAPLGGPPQRLADLASVRWSPDGTRITGVQANPLVGDAIAVANADGTNPQVLVPASGGIHLHQVAWSHDGHYVYYARSIEPNHTLGEIYRVPTTGGGPELVVRTPGVALYPAPTPDGLSVIYAGDRNGEGLNIWRHPLDGSPDVRLTTGAGEYTEPYVSRDGRFIVCLARRRSGEVIRIDVDAAPESATAVTTVGAAGSSDGEPSTSPGTDRTFVTSSRGGRRRIWSIDARGGDARPITSADALDQRPVVSPDGTHLAFTSNRGGQRGVWIVAAEGGTPRQLVSGEVLDRVSWSPDSRRLVYALSGPTAPTIWTIGADGGAPQAIAGVHGRVPVWSPHGDSIAVVDATDGRPEVHFATTAGAPAGRVLPIEPVSLPTAMAWSPDGSRLALVNLPGRAAAEVWLLTVADGSLRRLQHFAAPAELDGITWSSDGKALLIGRRDFESEVLLLRVVK